MKLSAGYKRIDKESIPDGWAEVLLDSVAKRGSGHTPDKKHPEYWNGEIKWVSLADSQALDNLYIKETAATITAVGIANSSAVLHPSGTVILSRDAGVGKSAIMQCEMAVSQHFMAWQCGPHLDNHFLYYWLQFEKPEFERIADGSTIKTIGLPYFKTLRIQLPPLYEQQAISKALRDVDALINSLGKLIAKKRDIKQAAMQELLIGRKRLSGFTGEWELKTLGEIGCFIKGKGIRKNQVVPSGLACVRYGEIYTDYDDYIRDFRSFISPQTAVESQRLLNGDLLFAGSGETAEEIGKCVAFLGDEEAYAGGDIVILRPNDQNAMYLSYLMNSATIVEQKARLAQGDAVVHISARNLSRLEFYLPEYKEQVAIAEVLSGMDTEITALEARRDKTRLLKQGMMQELLTGRIRLV